ncbi:MAG: hypothetical protein DYG98_12685 [Haliscomenobacteraceae bacterium CHB4]|nr:hypothetical protein [Haliscomenobacteraceae bacterium CHB4]
MEKFLKPDKMLFCPAKSNLPITLCPKTRRANAEKHQVAFPGVFNPLPDTRRMPTYCITF